MGSIMGASHPVFVVLSQFIAPDPDACIARSNQAKTARSLAALRAASVKLRNPRHR